MYSWCTLYYQKPHGNANIYHIMLLDCPEAHHLYQYTQSVDLDNQDDGWEKPGSTDCKRTWFYISSLTCM